MSTDLVIRAEKLSKQYRLGVIGRTALHEDLSRWWARVRGQPDPTMKVSEFRHADDETDEDHVLALQDINFEVRKGEVLGIIGGNGSGKSTLLKLLSRVTAPTTGSIKLKGRVASLLEVGTGFHPELTGRENIFLNGAVLGMTKDEVSRNLDAIIAFSDIGKYIDTPVKRYSSGMYVRLAFSVAAHLEADILLVDEVLAVGDAEFQKKCVGKMKDVAGHGRTVLFVSHNMSLIESLCTRGICLEKGRLVKEGPILSVIEQYIRSNGPAEHDDRVKDIKRKTSTGKPWLEEIFVRDQSGTRNQSIGMGEPFQIEIALRSWKKINAAKIAIGLHDAHDRRILTVGTDLDPDFGLTLDEGAFQRITCAIPSNFLMAGKYHLTVAVVGQFELLDNLEHVCPFQVVSRDFFGTGRQLTHAQGVVVCKSVWSAEDADRNGAG